MQTRETPLAIRARIDADLEKFAAEERETRRAREYATLLNRASPMGDPPTAPPPYSAAFDRSNTFILRDVPVGFRMGLSGVYSRGGDASGFVGLSSDFLRLSDKQKDTIISVGYQRQSTQVRASADINLGKDTTYSFQGKVTPTAGGAFHFSADDNGFITRAGGDVTLCSVDSRAVLSLTQSFASGIAAAASYVHQLTPQWRAGTKVTVDPSHTPIVSHEVTLERAAVCMDKQILGRTNVPLFPQAELSQLRLADDVASVTYHKQVNHALAWESAFVVGLNEGAVDSEARVGLRLRAPRGTLAASVSTSQVYRALVRYSPIQEIGFHASSTYHSATETMTFGAGIELAPQQENFPRVYRVRQPSGGWWDRWVGKWDKRMKPYRHKSVWNAVPTKDSFKVTPRRQKQL